MRVINPQARIEGDPIGHPTLVKPPTRAQAPSEIEGALREAVIESPAPVKVELTVTYCVDPSVADSTRARGILIEAADTALQGQLADHKLNRLFSGKAVLVHEVEVR